MHQFFDGATRWRIMRLRTRVLVVACAGAFAYGLYADSSRGRQRGSVVASDVVALEAAIASIEAGRQATPLIGEPRDGESDATVTFLARRIGDRVPRIVSDVTGWGEHTDGTFDFTVGTMTRVAQSEWYALDAKVAPRARIEYLVAYGVADRQFDLHNPRQSAGRERGGLPASEFVMPGYVPPPEFTDRPVSPAGVTTEALVERTSTRAPYRIVVHTPPGYRERVEHPMAVFIDLRHELVSRVLDWLVVHEAIEPLVGVFVGPASRGEHLAGDALRTILTDELPAWVASRYSVSRRAADRAVIGISYGAKDALESAMSPPAVFDRVGLLIPGRRMSRADIDAFAARRDRRLRVAILGGQYDHANIDTARHLRQALAGAGHAVDYIEVPEGHSAVTWSNHLGALMVKLFGAGEASAARASALGPPGSLHIPEGRPAMGRRLRHTKRDPPGAADQAGLCGPCAQQPSHDQEPATCPYQ